VTSRPTGVGEGLLPARSARAVEPGERIHVVGVAGAGASAAALLGSHAGAVVSGCDPGGPSPYTAALDAARIPISWSHDPLHVTTSPRPARLAVTKALTAVAPDHPELEAARHLGIPLEPWQQVVVDAAVGSRLVAVAGTHGKSTTAGWLVHVLADAGTDPRAFVGALMPPELTNGLPATARWGSGPAFVVEADEYAGNFDAYRPEIATLTSVDWDHPDVFSEPSTVIAAFASWLRAAADDDLRPTIVANTGDAGVVDVLDALQGWPGRIVTVALVDTGTGQPAPPADLSAEIRSVGPAATTISVRGIEPGQRARSVRLSIAGRHNISNALVAAATAQALGIDSDAIVKGLATFQGVGRRLERKGEAAGVVVYDDYGHHPTAIRATLEALRQREPKRRVWAVYEPLTYHRTAAFLGAFAEVLATADAVAIADIWAGRDRNTRLTSATALAQAVARRRPEIPIAAPGSVEATAEWLAREVRSGDAVLVMGGGKSYRIGERLLEILETR
jgi:UDP-N-acetylmuramate--alanine ligase